MKIPAWTIVILCALPSLARADVEVKATGENLLENGGFERGAFDEKGVPASWYSTGDVKNMAYRWCADEGRNGSRCVFASGTRGRAGLAHVKVRIDPKKTYVLYAWVRTEDLPDGKVWIRVGTGGRRIPTQHVIIRVPASKTWTRYVALVRDLDPGATAAVVTVQMRDRAKGSAWVDDVFFGEGEAGPFESDYPVPALPGTRTSATAEPSGFFRVEKVEGVWWLVEPDGSLMWSTGSCSTGYANAVLAENLGLTRRDAKKVRALVAASMERAVDFGFNSLGAWSALDAYGFDIRAWNRERREAGKEPLYYFYSLNCANAGLSDRSAIREGFLLEDIHGETQGGDRAQGHRMCDPFHPAWARALDRYLARKTAGYKDDPDLVGWFTDNEIALYGLYQYLWSPYALRAFVVILKRRYASATELNASWSTENHRFAYEAISPEALREDPPDLFKASAAFREDVKAFEKVLAERYVDTIVTTLKKHDPNHLVIGNRWGTMDVRVLPYLEHFLPAFSKFDICAANLYPHPAGGKQVADANTKDQLEWIRALSRITGRPVLIGEFGTAARDSGVAVKRWAPRTLDTDVQRGASYRKMVTTWYRLPFVVGAHWFKWSNGYGYGGNTGRDPRSCGLVDDWNHPYADLVEAIREANAAIEKAGRRADFDIDDLPFEKE